MYIQFKLSKGFVDDPGGALLSVTVFGVTLLYFSTEIIKHFV